MELLLSLLPSPLFHPLVPSSSAVSPAAAASAGAPVVAPSPIAASAADAGHPLAQCLLVSFSYLDTVSLARLAAVNRPFARLASENVLWKPLAQATYPELAHRRDDTEWKACYKRKRVISPQIWLALMLTYNFFAGA